MPARSVMSADSPVPVGLRRPSVTGAHAPARRAAPCRSLHAGIVTEQDVPAMSYSEPDTVVEPDVAVSPVDPMIAVAASHDGRFPDGGAVGISYAWTHDGGATWHHQPVPGLTRTTGGAHVWARASDPVLAFGPDGTVYLSHAADRHRPARAPSRCRAAPTAE